MVTKTLRRAYNPTMNDSTPSRASSTLVPPLSSSVASAATKRKIPATTSWRPNSTAMT
jgi:hypothetical protein